MEIFYTKMIESFVVIVLFIISRKLLNKIINKTIVSKVIQKSRGQLIKKIINLINLIVFSTLMMIIWGVNQSQLIVFVGSVLTIVGVAFFAQWSLLSNITSSVIIFFGHSVKIGDTISIMEAKDYEIRGEVLDIGLFFTKMKLENSDDEMTLPNNIFIQKTVRRIGDQSKNQVPNT